MNTIKQLQIGLAKDLVNFEQRELSEEQLEMIEETYQQVYLILNTVEKDQ